VTFSANKEGTFVDAGLMSGALQQMARFSDKRLSLTDCASFETMNRLGLSSAFSFDRHFRQFRVCFVWTAEGSKDVGIVDYH